jgi:hypothetical protein
VKVKVIREMRGALLWGGGGNNFFQKIHAAPDKGSQYECEDAELMSNCIIWKNKLVALTARGIQFDEFKSGGLHEKHGAATWYIGTISAFA